jgi:hypothetical protein
MGYFLLYPPANRYGNMSDTPYNPLASGVLPLDIYNAQTLAPGFDPARFYIIAGDEVNHFMDDTVFNLFDAATLANLKTNFQHIPRLKFFEWMDTNLKTSLINAAQALFTAGMEDSTSAIYQSYLNAGGVTALLPDPAGWDAILAKFFDFYNKANLEYLTSNNLNVWVWEYMKILSWQQAYPNDPINEKYTLTIPFIKQAVKDHIKASYEDLDTIADFGYELSRAAAVDKLLSLEEYFDAMSLVGAYANLDPAHAALLTTEFEKENLILDYATSPPISPSDHPLASM